MWRTGHSSTWVGVCQVWGGMRRLILRYVPQPYTYHIFLPYLTFLFKASYTWSGGGYNSARQFAVAARARFKMTSRVSWVRMVGRTPRTTFRCAVSKQRCKTFRCASRIRLFAASALIEAPRCTLQTRFAASTRSAFRRSPPLRFAASALRCLVASALLLSPYPCEPFRCVCTHRSASATHSPLFALSA